MNTKEVRRRRAMQKRRRQRKRKRTRQLCIRITAVIFLAVLVLFSIFKLPGLLQKNKKENKQAKAIHYTVEPAPELEVQLLTPNAYSRPQTALKKIKGIVIHYTANPGTTAAQNRDYFEGLKDSKQTKASSHFIVGLDGEIVQCIPSAEIAYASNERNEDTISIENCHPDETGKFNQKTYDSLVHLTAWLCGKFEIATDDIIRHYDVTGKKCPLYFVEHEKQWEQFIKDVENYIQKHKVER